METVNGVTRSEASAMLRRFGGRRKGPKVRTRRAAMALTEQEWQTLSRACALDERKMGHFCRMHVMKAAQAVLAQNNALNVLGALGNALANQPGLFDEPDGKEKPEDGAGQE